MQKINFKSKLELDSLTVLCKAQYVIDRNGGGNEKTDFFSIWFSFSVLENAVKKNRNVFLKVRLCQNEFIKSSIFQINNSKIWRISVLNVLKLNISRYRTIWPDFFCIFKLGLPCVLKVISTTFWLRFK